MSYITSPNMSLTIPSVGNEAGPDYALDINASLVLVDAHDHTPGKGAPITSGSLNINADLSFNNHSALSVKGIQLTAQTLIPTVSTIYESGSDLYFVDAIGNNIRLTIAGAVAGTPGSITNLLSPATASYIAGSSVFVWQSNVNKAADMDFGSAIMRNISPNSTYSMTLAPPAAMTSSTTITLPVLPAVESFMTMDNSGQIIVTIPRAAGINTINIAPNAITTSKITDLNVTTAKLADQSVTTAKIADGSVTAAKLSSGAIRSFQSQIFYSSTTFVIPAGVTSITITGSGGGGGGGGGGTVDGGSTYSGGLGGGAAMLGYEVRAVTPGQSVTIVIGAGGAGGSANASSGATGGFTYCSPFPSGDVNFYGGSGGAAVAIATGASLGGSTASFPGGSASSTSVGGAGGLGSGGGGGGVVGYGGGSGGSGILRITWLA